MSQKRQRSPSPPTSTPHSYQSNAIKDRGSIFIAAFLPHTGSISISTKPTSTPASASTLQSLEPFSSASHRMAAWRFPSTQTTLVSNRTVYATGHDDDGEANGGRKLENLLRSQNVVGTIVVARWFGGTMLGPVRFDHIENCAREAIEEWRRKEDDGAKRRRTEAQEQIRAQALIKVLMQRDESITALRGLLAEKQGKGVEATRAPPDYGKMTVAVLGKLEKARDATIAWILKELDKAEAEQAVQDGEFDVKDTGIDLDEADGVEAEKRSHEDQKGETSRPMSSDKR